MNFAIAFMALLLVGYSYWMVDELLKTKRRSRTTAMEIKYKGESLEMPIHEMLPSVEESSASLSGVLGPSITDLFAK
jgi:hypothetical protein